LLLKSLTFILDVLYLLKCECKQPIPYWNKVKPKWNVKIYY